MLIREVAVDSGQHILHHICVNRLIQCQKTGHGEAKKACILLQCLPLIKMAIAVSDNLSSLDSALA